MNYKDIISYYTYSQILYRLFWYSSETLAMHIGFWNKNTKSLDEAVLNENQCVAEFGHITNKSRVLDAGCGVGGTAMYIAKNIGAWVEGISITPSQIQLAKKYVKKQDILKHIHFSVQDFSHTNFPDKSFDVVYGIESVSSAYPKTKFLKEAHRILKPKGILVIADGYCAYKPRNNEEIAITFDFCRAFALEEMKEARVMENDIEKSGFRLEKALNMTRYILPSIEKYRKLSQKYRFIANLLRYIPFPFAQAFLRNHIAITKSVEAVEKGLFVYYIHVASKT